MIGTGIGLVWDGETRRPAAAPSTPIERESVRSHWIRLHRFPYWARQYWDFWNPQETLRRWLEEIPCAACSSHIQLVREAIPFDPSTPETWILSAITWHNAVNTAGHAIGNTTTVTPPFDPIFHATVWDDADPPQQSPMPLTVVTSFGEIGDPQRRAIRSWNRFGLQVRAVQHHSEISQIERSLGPLRASVAIRAVGDEALSKHERPTPTINAIIDTATQWNEPVLLLNSDCELHGSNAGLRSALEARQPAVWIRRNWEGVPGDGELEPDGLDCFLLWPEHARCLSRIGLSIGRPFWDYWLPWELEQLGHSMTWRGEPMVYHRRHPLNWSEADWLYGYHLFVDRFEQHIDWAAWRRNKPFGRRT